MDQEPNRPFNNDLHLLYHTLGEDIYRPDGRNNDALNPLPSKELLRRGPKTRRRSPIAESKTIALVDQSVYHVLRQEIRDEGHRRLFTYLATGGCRDKATWKTLLGRNTLMALTRRGASDLTIDAVLREFRQHTGVTLKLDPHSGYTGRDTVIEDIDWGDLVQIAERICDPQDEIEDRTEAATGTLFDRVRLEENRSDLIAAARYTARNDDARWLLNALNPSEPSYEDVRFHTDALRAMAATVHADAPLSLCYDR